MPLPPSLPPCAGTCLTHLLHTTPSHTSLTHLLHTPPSHTLLPCAGTCPRNPMLCPRRVADPSGQLPTLGVGTSPTLSQSGYLPSTSPSTMGSFPAGTSYDLGSPMGSPQHPGSPGFTTSNRPATAMSSRSGAGGYGAGMAAAGPSVVATRPSTARSGPVSGGWVGGLGQGGGSPRGVAARVQVLSGGGGVGGSSTQR